MNNAELQQGEVTKNVPVKILLRNIVNGQKPWLHYYTHNIAKNETRGNGPSSEAESLRIAGNATAAPYGISISEEHKNSNTRFSADDSELPGAVWGRKGKTRVNSIVSACMQSKKPGAVQAVNAADAATHVTSETKDAQAPGTDTIAQTTTGVNTNSTSGLTLGQHTAFWKKIQ